MISFKPLKDPFKILLLVMIIIIAAQSTILLKNPPIWPDEAIYADIANNWLNEQRLGPDIWQETFNGATQHFYWYPPFFFVLIASYFKLFGLSIVSQRLLSQTASIIFLAVFFLLAKSLFKNQKMPIMAIIPIIGLALDPFFSRAARLGRPEMVVMLLGSLSFLAYIKSTNSKNTLRIRHFLLIISGILSSVAFLTHLLGGTFFAAAILTNLLFKEKMKFFKSQKFYLFGLSFLVAPSVWALSILPNFAVFKEQFFLARKAADEYSPFILQLAFGDTFYQTLFLSYVLISAAFFLVIIVKRAQNLVPFAIILSLSWVTIIYGKGTWYFVYVVPWVYLAATYLIGRFFEELQKKSSKSLIFQASAATFLITFLAGIFFNIKLIIDLWPNKYSYGLFMKKILTLVPESKTVFLSSIPDPYFGFKSQGRKNTLYEFPVVQIEKEKFLNLLNNSDYIVFNGVYNSMTELLPAYINKNTQNTISIGSENQYKALIIELKPRNQREAP